MDVVKLSDFVSEFSCRYGENQIPIVSHKFFKKEHLVDSIENDTDLFDLHGLLFIYRSYFMLLKGEVVQKVLERCMEFMTVNPHSNPQHMFKATLKPLNKKGIMKNAYRRDESTMNVSVNVAISLINRIIESGVVGEYYDDYDNMAEKIQEVTNEFFPGYIVQMSIIDDIIRGSMHRAKILNGGSVQNPHAYALSQSALMKYETSFDKEPPKDVTKELLFHNLLVTQHTKDSVDILSTNVMIAFNAENIESHRNHLTKNIIFINMATNVTCFASWEDMRNWAQSNSEDVQKLINTLSQVKAGSYVDQIKDTSDSILFDYFTVFKKPLFDHVESLSVGSTFDEVDKNKNRQKLFSGMQNILERLIANK